MYLDLFENKTLNAMENYMGRLSQRQQIVASNIANIDTPGYKTRDVSFHATMEELLAGGSEGNLRTTRARHIDARMFTPPINQVDAGGQIERADQNNVDIDREMMKLSETSFGYSMMTQMLRGKLRTLATGINEGRA